MTHIENLIKKAYAAFNARDIAAALSTFHPNVHWPKAFEGGHVKGHDEVRAYWTKQWSEINPNVQPVEFNKRKDGKLAVTVHQKVKDLQDHVIFDGLVTHIYTIQDDLLSSMDVEI